MLSTGTFTLLLASQTAFATSPSIYELTLKELMAVKVVTAASGFEQKLNKASANATVITREEWQAMGAFTLSEVLDMVSGVHVTTPQLNFNHHIINIRGMGGSFGEQVKLLIDGKQLEYVKDSGIFVGFNMPIDQFKQIEIVKGPGSAIYGADAFAGVINLVSYDVNEVPTTLVARSGQFNTQTFSLGKSFKTDEHLLSLTLDYAKSDDDPNRIVHNDLQSTFDNLFGSNASNTPGPIDNHYRVMNLQARWQWQNWSLRYHTWRNFDYGLGAGVAQALDDKGHGSIKNDLLTFNWDLSEAAGFGQLDLSATVSYGRVWSTLHVFPEGAILPINASGNLDLQNPLGLTTFHGGYIGSPGSENLNKSIALTHLFNLKDHKIRYELGYEKIDFEPIEYKNFGPSILDGSQTDVDATVFDVSSTPWVYVPEISRHFYYLSLLDQWQINPKWQLSIGARLDHYSDFGTTTNPRISLQYQLSENHALKLFGGSAFRAPSIGELYYQNNPVVNGNPDLGPEGINTYETGLGLDMLVSDNLFINFSVFNYQANDLIETVFNTTTNSSSVENVGKQQGRGGELTLRWKPATNITLNFSYSLLSTKRNDIDNVADIPHKMWKLDMNWRISENWHWAFDSHKISDRHRAMGDNRPAIADFQRFNTRLSYHGLLPGLSLAIRGKNIFDEDARDPSTGAIAEDYPLAGRQWLLELSMKF